MATLEKLQKSLESLKNIVKSSTPAETRKKEKIQLCHSISEAISNPTIKVSPSFNIILEVTIEIFLELCDDPESDVRMICDECLNRVIRIASDTHMSKIQIELHKEIKKNGAPRSLRAALFRFSQLSAHIRTHKGKAYVTNLFPSIIKICERNEELIHETLANSFPKIIDALGCFAPESETKVLLKAFLKNVTKSSTVIRRTSSSCILNICLNSRRPYSYVCYCINNLLDLLLPLDENLNEATILGVLGCLKCLLPCLNVNNFSKSNIGYTKDLEIQLFPIHKLLQIYELCLIFLKNKDHNVVIASFETLNVLLTNAQDDLRRALLNSNGLVKSRITRLNIFNSNKRSPSQLSVSTTVTANEDSLFSECELTETVETDIEKWINESKLTMLNSPVTLSNTKSLSVHTLADLSDKNVEMTDFSVPHVNEILLDAKKSDSGDNLDRISDNSSEKSCSVAGVDTEEIQEVDIGDFLDKSVPLLHSTRLIVKSFLLYGVPNKYINDRIVRVSVKSSAISCLTSIFRIFPAGFYEYLDKNYIENVKDSLEPKISSQKMSNLLLFAEHSDPQIRGAISNLVADLLVTIHKSSFSDTKSWSKDDFYQLLYILEKGLTDESSNCLRQTLTSLNPLLNLLAGSSCCESILVFLKKLPLLSSNPYWLVKVSLCELVSELCYTTIFHITGNNNFQNQVIYNVLFECLKDSDQRIRTAAAAAFVEIVSRLYYPEFNPKESVVTEAAEEMYEHYSRCLEDKELDYNINKQHFVRNMPFPYSEISHKSCKKAEFNLSKIVSKLYVNVLTSSSKHFVAGCVETLSLLSSRFPPTVYTRSWNTVRQSDTETSTNDIPDILSLCVTLLTSSSLVFDVQFHICALNLTGNIYAGYSYSNILPVRDSEHLHLWNMFSNQPLRSLSDNLVSFIMKLLHVYHVVLNDIVPTPPQSKMVLPHLPSSTSTLSPVKKVKSGVEKKPTVLGKLQEKDEKMESAKNIDMSFVTSQHYMKIYEVLKKSFMNYKISLDEKVSEKFVELLKTLLQCLSIILEVSSLNEFGKIFQEILLYLKSTFTLDSVSTVQCVQQLLKCLFGTNFTCNVLDILEGAEYKSEKSRISSLYQTIFETPFDKIANTINLLRNGSKLEFERDESLMGFSRRKDIKKPSVTRDTSDKTLSSYIRIFEPIVIKSLKHYTMTGNVRFHSQVLELLSQLVQLRVNYCLLDSEQVFKDFVLKQFEFIEEGQIRHSEELLPKIFQFLVHLSYSKQHSKSIIEIPKIIQLCDGLMASGQSPETHCIPGLEAIIEDVFLIKNKSNTADLKELETTRDVVFTMLLRLFEHKDVIDLVALILEDCKLCTDSWERWQRFSGQGLSVFLSLIKQNKIKIDDVDAFVSLKKFVSSLHPDVLHRTDEVIVLLFQSPPQMNDSTSFKRWLSKVAILLLILLPLNEGALLLNINKLKADFSPGSIFENHTPSADPLNVHNNADIFGNIPAEIIVVKMIFKIISSMTLKLVEVEQRCSDTFLVNQCFLFLVCCAHIFQSGNYRKISDTTISEVDQLNIEEINSRFTKLRRFYPILTLHWWYILTLLNYEDLTFWKSILSEHNICKDLCECVVLQGGIIVLCDLSKSPVDANPFTCWMSSRCSETIVNLIEEPTVYEHVCSIFQNPETSRHLLNSLTKIDCSSNNPRFTKKLFKTLDLCDVSQTGTVIKFIASTSVLDQRQIAVARMASILATRKLELLLTLDAYEVQAQLSVDDILDVKNSLSSKDLDKKNETLVSLLNKVLIKFYKFSPEDFENTHQFHPESIKNLKIGREWYLIQMESKACDLKQVAYVLSDLHYKEIMEIFTKNDKNKRNFGRSLISKCLEVGVELTKYRNTREESAILKAAIEVLFLEIEDVIRKERSDKDTNERIFFNSLECNIQSTHLATSLMSLMHCLREIEPLNISEREFTSIFQVTTILLEYLVDHTRTDTSHLSINKLENYLNCVVEVLNRPEFFTIFATDDNIYWLCLLVDNVHSLIEYLLIDSEPLPSIDTYMLKTVIENDLTKRAGQACHNLYILVHWLYRIEILNSDLNIPNFLFSKIRKIVILLGRLTQFYSYILVPLRVWKTGWEPEMSGKFLTEVPALPMDYLQELDVLEEFIFRVNLFGWTSRQQFEETWMCYLSVLCYPLDTIDSLDLSNAIKASSHAIKAITALLMQTLRDPILGNKSLSILPHVTRNKSINSETISVNKLKMIQNSIAKQLASKQASVDVKNIFQQINFEKSSDDYSYGQLSIKYFTVAINAHVWDGCAACQMYKTRRKMLKDSGIDVTSCLQFLLDYYTQLIKAESSVTNLGLLHEIVKSIVLISDLFTDKTQFEWMQNMFLDLIKMHSYEDELLHQYLIVGLCKAVAVLCPELELFEQTKKLLVQFLRTPSLPSRISCLYGILYLLEGCLLNNTKIGGVSEETQLLLPSIVEYIQTHLNTTNCVLKRSQEHRLLVWSLAFFLIESIDEIHMETLFVDTTLLSAFEVLRNKTVDYVSKCIFKGLERLLVVKPQYISEKIGQQLYSLALQNLKFNNSTTFLMGFQLLLTYMYTDCAKQLEEGHTKPEANPDQLVQTIEKTSAIFEAVKKGHTLEAEIICAVLPTVLQDFFSPSDILTKVIGEFLSSQQPYPKLMSGVVFKVFESAISQNQLSLLQDWVVFSLSNFTQSFSNMVVWSLTCFFISASTNKWLRATFPYVQSRIGRYDQEDKHMFCVAGSDFYRNLSNAQKKTFVDSFTKAKDHPDTPFYDLLCSL